MSKILCSLSGIMYSCEYMPRSLMYSNRESHHPIFDASFKQLESLAIDWQNGLLDETQSYLLYLALFNKTELVQFRSPAIRGNNTDSVVAQNLPSLFKIVDTILYTGSERAKTKYLMPVYVISTEGNTQDLSNSSYWIRNWESCHQEYLSGYKSSTLIEKLSHKESILESMIRDRSKDISSYGLQMASWAALAGDFKSIDCFVADGSNNDRPILLSEYWKRIIIQCAKRANVYEIHDGDLLDLIEHLEESMDIISSGIPGHTLLSLLRSTLKTKQAYFNLGDVDVGINGTVYKILDAEASTEDANKIVLIDSAPLYEPKVMEYPSRLHYVRAKAKWDMAQRYKESDRLRLEIESKSESKLTVALNNLLAVSTPMTTEEVISIMNESEL